MASVNNYFFRKNPTILFKTYFLTIGQSKNYSPSKIYVVLKK